MNTQQPRRKIQNLYLRVLIIGRANAGKTSILQRVCETTDSPVVYRGWGEDRKEVKLDPTMERGEHEIDDELVFSNHDGYIFHDSRGIESGSTTELSILQEFIRRKGGEKFLRSRLHAIWYCVPMDNHRPQLDLRFYKDICLDGIVPVIVVFTKFDQFRRNVEMNVADYPSEYSGNNVSELEVAERLFQEHYLRPLGDNVRYVRLEKMHIKDSYCDDLLETTAASLNEGAVALMLLATQKDNVELGVKTALNRIYSRNESDVKRIIWECLVPFPYVENAIKSTELGTEYAYGVDLSTERSSFLDTVTYDSQRAYARDHPIILHVMSLPTIQKIIKSYLGYHHLILALILIFKHATFLRLSDSTPESALTHVELAYQKANIDWKIQQFLSSQELSVKKLAAFIMATDIDIVVPSQSSAKIKVKSSKHRFKLFGRT